MSELARDIETLLDAAFHELAGVEIGTIENCEGESVVIDSNLANMAITRAELFSMFSDAPETSRIAIVYVRCAQDHAYGGAWAQAARDFCYADIAGILVIGGNALATSLGKAERAKLGWTTDILAVERKMFDLFPSDFKETGLPVLYDESGILCDVMSKSRLLDHDVHLKFAFSDYPLALELVHNGTWIDETCFPVLEAAGSAREDEFAQRIAEAARYKEEWFFADTLSFLFEQPLLKKEISLESCAKYMNDTFGDIFDIEDLNLLGGKSRRLDISYAISMPQGANADLDRVLRQIKLASDIRRLLNAAFPEAYEEGFDRSQILKLCHEKGVDHQIRALGAGVPFEDVVA